MKRNQDKISLWKRDPRWTGPDMTIEELLCSDEVYGHIIRAVPMFDLMHRRAFTNAEQVVADQVKI